MNKYIDWIVCLSGFMIGNTLLIANSVGKINRAVKKKSLEKVFTSMLFLFISVFPILIFSSPFNFQRYSFNAVNHELILFVSFLIVGIIWTKFAWEIYQIINMFNPILLIKNLVTIGRALNKKNIRKILFFIFSLIVLYILIISCLSQLSISIRILIILFLGFVLFLSESFRKKKDGFQEYIIPNGLFRDKILNFCNNAGVTNVELYFFPDKKTTSNYKPIINAWTNVKLIGASSIFLSRICEDTDFEIVKALIGHELRYIKNRDNNIVTSLKLFLTIMSVFSFFIPLFYLLVDKISKIYIIGPIINIIFALFLLIFVIVFIIFTLINHRYGPQIQELRADRQACKIEGVSKEKMLELFKTFELELEKKSKEKEPKWYKEIYERYFKEKEHPCLSRRIELISN